MRHTRYDGKVVLSATSKSSDCITCHGILIQSADELEIHIPLSEVASDIAGVPSHFRQTYPVIQVGQSIYPVARGFCHGRSYIGKHVGGLFLGIEDVQAALSLSYKLQEPSRHLVLEVASF